MTVTLEQYELEMGAIVGAKRTASSIAKKLKSKRAGSRKHDWNEDVEAALAECAAARVLDKYWSGSVDTFKSVGDVGDLEIRHTSLEDGSLIIRPKDKEDAIYVLVTGIAPTFDVVGWIKGKDGMNKKYMRNPRGRGVAFFVPQEDLKSIIELKTKK